MKEDPTDEELALFISRMEQQKLYAPGHLKEEILKLAKQAFFMQEECPEKQAFFVRICMPAKAGRWELD